MGILAHLFIHAEAFCALSSSQGKIVFETAFEAETLRNRLQIHKHFHLLLLATVILLDLALTL